jgi:signal transduction histidine kinase
MRLLSFAAGVLLLLALLTWLLLRGTDTNARAYSAALQTLDDFALAEASLQRDVLQARAGLLRNYDPLDAAEEAMEDAIGRLRSYAQSENLSTESIDRLGAAVAEQEELAERFKSSVALLQNSLAYVGVLSTGPMFGATDAQFAPAIGAMAAAVLHLARDTSSDAVQALEERIDHFAAEAPAAGPDAQAAQALLAHTRLLRDLLPATDATLRALIAGPTETPLEAARALFADHQAAVEATAQRYLLLLYLASLLLVVALVRLGLRLRARALALRRRAAFEHVIAENSTRLINCPPAETAARLTQVLAELGRAMGGVERAYVVLAENPTRVHAWCAQEAPFPDGWPEDALALSEQLGDGGHDIVTVPDVAALPPGEAKNKLKAVGLRGWACVSLNRPGRVRGIMGFDKFQPAWSTVFPVPVVLLAGDAVANAIDREFLERDRARLATRLERSRRMQMIGSLASGIAHNFNNIIGAILGYSEMAEPEVTPGSKPAQHIDEIKRAAERGRDLVDHILTFGRRRDVRVQPIKIRALFDEAASLLRATLPEGVELLIADVPADIAVLGEPAQLQQVILNLCNNAAQAMEGHGRIRVAADLKELAAPSTTMSHGDLALGRYVCLSVEDTGRGFDERVARRLFEPFFTTRSAGTGLGLATVQEIVRDHDGAMNVRSSPGRGSRFEAWLPAAAMDGSVALDPSALPLGRGETVLVVESERDRRLRDEEMLAALGYEPVGFERADEAIAACRAAPGRFDVMLISHVPNALDGLDVARVLHGIAPRCPVLLVIVSTNGVSVDALAQAGIVEVLPRPVDNAELAIILKRCLRSTGAISDS